MPTVVDVVHSLLCSISGDVNGVVVVYKNKLSHSPTIHTQNEKETVCLVYVNVNINSILHPEPLE